MSKTPSRQPLRELRKNRRLSLQAVADANRVNIGWLSRVERGLIQPRYDLVMRLAQYFGVRPELIVPPPKAGRRAA